MLEEIVNKRINEWVESPQFDSERSNLAKDSLRDDLTSLAEKNIPGVEVPGELFEALEENDMLKFGEYFDPFRESLDNLPEATKKAIEEDLRTIDNAINSIEEFGAGQK